MNSNIERKTFEININVKDENVLYNSFNEFNKTLSDDVYNYIKSREKLAHLTDKIQLNLISSEDINKDNFIEAFHNYIDEQLELNKKEIKFSVQNQIWMLLIGIIFIIFSIGLSQKLNEVIIKIIATIGSFSIWESANSFLVVRRRLKAKKLRLYRLKNCEIIFKLKGE